MKEPKILLHRFKNIFQIGCFLIAIYFTTLFTAHYLENYDEQLITMSKFNREDDNNYPTFSLCFKGNTKFHWFHDLEIFHSYGLNVTQYELMLKGEPVTKYDRNRLTRTYNKTPIFVNDGIDVDFNNFHLQPSDFIRSLSFFTEKALNDTHIANAQDWDENEKPPLSLSYQTPETICFSRNSKDFLNIVRLYDLITLNSESMIESLTTNMNTSKDIEMDIFVHYPNQLIRSFGKSKYSTSFDDLRSSLVGRKMLEFKLTECKRIKRRVDAVEPCSGKIKNEKITINICKKDLVNISVVYQHISNQLYPTTWT